jgi:pimeloyl-ACP methyl ester carboxylesterase
MKLGSPSSVAKFTLLAALGTGSVAIPATAKPAKTAPPHTRAVKLPPGGHYANIRGLHMYYEEHGHGPVLVLLHGGGETIESSFAPEIAPLARHHRVIAPEQMGQGHTPDLNRPLSYSDMTEDTAALLRHLRVTQCDIVGWSDGGILGLMLAQRYPTLVHRLVASGANYDPSGLTAATITWLHTVKPKNWGRGRFFYEKVSPDGPGHWPVMVDKLKTLWLKFPVARELSPQTMAAIRCPVLVMAGDHDVIRTDHTIAIARSIRHSSLCILPDTPHEVFTERPEWVTRIIMDFLAQKGRFGKEKIS